MKAPIVDARYIREGDILFAIHIPATYTEQGIHFFTPNNFSQQLAFMAHPSGKAINAHVHNPVRREVFFTNETLLIRKGHVRVDFYGPQNDYRFSEVVGPGDVLLLVSGGHGFEILDDCEMIEIKQGPYAGDRDKTLISNVSRQSLIYRSST